MDSAAVSASLTTQRHSSAASLALRSVLRAAGPSLVLGLVSRGLLYLIANLFDQSHANVAFVGELLSRLSWSVIVCMGLAAALFAVKHRALAMGAAGSIAAPIAFFVSRGMHKGVVDFLHLIEVSDVPSPTVLAVLKGGEYACLGIILGWLGQRRRGTSRSYAAIGATIGVVFGGAILAFNASVTPAALGPAGLLSWVVNEVLFPIGCSLVVFSGERRG
jgi:hypothetical protein